MSKYRVTLTLISEKIRFWTDERFGCGGEVFPPRIEDHKLNANLRVSLHEIDCHCKEALKEIGMYDATFHTFMELSRLLNVLLPNGYELTKEQAEAVHACANKLGADLISGKFE